MSMIAGVLKPSQFVAASTCISPRLAVTTAGCTVAARADSNAPAVTAACAAACSACAAAAPSHAMYWVATAIMAAAEGPSHEPLVNSEVTELNDDTADANSSAKPPQAAAAASSGPAPGPANISAELISGGNHAKCGFVTSPNYLATAATVAVSASEKCRSIGGLQEPPGLRRC